MHTKDILAAELIKAGLREMAVKAATGYYHDFLSPLPTLCLQLAAHRADIEALRIWREKVAQTYADQIVIQQEIIAAIKTDAAAQDAEFAKAIARREAMLGESQPFKMAAE